jgi:hypothetical protein
LNNLKTGEKRFPRDDTFHSQTVLRRFEGKKQWFILRLITVNNQKNRRKGLKVNQLDEWEGVNRVGRSEEAPEESRSCWGYW